METIGGEVSRVLNVIETLDEVFTISSLSKLTGLAQSVLYPILCNLTRDGVLVRLSNLSYLKVRKPVEIDFKTASVETVSLRLPLDLNSLVEITPASIVIVAGVPNSGKTAFLLNVIHDNMDTFEIDYYSSELNAVRIKQRLDYFQEGKDNEILWKFNAYEIPTSQSFPMIRPNAISIVDFLEIYDQFYRVGEYINNIFRKLRKGIAIIALQKNPKTDWGIGGIRSLEKAHLYLSLDSGVIKIVKAKDWASTLNPNGMSCKFKLYKGTTFKRVSEWSLSVKSQKEKTFIEPF